MSLDEVVYYLSMEEVSLTERWDREKIFRYLNGDAMRTLGIEDLYDIIAVLELTIDDDFVKDFDIAYKNSLPYLTQTSKDIIGRAINVKREQNEKDEDYAYRVVERKRTVLEMILKWIKLWLSAKLEEQRENNKVNKVAQLKVEEEEYRPADHINDPVPPPEIIRKANNMSDEKLAAAHNMTTDTVNKAASILEHIKSQPGDNVENKINNLYEQHKDVNTEKDINDGLVTKQEAVVKKLADKVGGVRIQKELMSSMVNESLDNCEYTINPKQILANENNMQLVVNRLGDDNQLVKVAANTMIQPSELTKGTYQDYLGLVQTYAQNLTNLTQSFGNILEKQEALLSNTIKAAFFEIDKQRDLTDKALNSVNTLTGQLGNKDTKINDLQDKYRQSEVDKTKAEAENTYLKKDVERLGKEAKEKDERLKLLEEENRKLRAQGFMRQPYINVNSEPSPFVPQPSVNKPQEEIKTDYSGPSVVQGEGEEYRSYSSNNSFETQQNENVYEQSTRNPFEQPQRNSNFESTSSNTQYRQPQSEYPHNRRQKKKREEKGAALDRIFSFRKRDDVKKELKVLLIDYWGDEEYLEEIRDRAWKFSGLVDELLVEIHAEMERGYYN